MDFKEVVDILVEEVFSPIEHLSHVANMLQTIRFSIRQF